MIRHVSHMMWLPAGGWPVFLSQKTDNLIGSAVWTTDREFSGFTKLQTKALNLLKRALVELD